MKFDNFYSYMIYSYAPYRIDDFLFYWDMIFFYNEHPEKDVSYKKQHEEDISYFLQGYDGEVTPEDISSLRLYVSDNI